MFIDQHPYVRCARAQEEGSSQGPVLALTTASSCLDLVIIEGCPTVSGHPRCVTINACILFLCMKLRLSCIF